MSRLIPLSQGKLAIVDDDDFDYLNQFKWYANKMGANWYAVRTTKVNLKRRLVAMHTYIINCEKPLVIDHIDHNGLNNQKSNLRICTRAENNANKTSRKNSYSKYLGVFFDKRVLKYYCQLGLNDKVYSKSGFLNEIDAAKAYNELAKIHHGEFANLNIIN